MSVIVSIVQDGRKIIVPRESPHIASTECEEFSGTSIGLSSSSTSTSYFELQLVQQLPCEYLLAFAIQWQSAVAMHMMNSSS